MGKKALVLQTSRAIGDRIFISWAPKQIRRRLGFDKVDCATWKDNAELWLNNPHVNKIVALEDLATESMPDVLAKFEKEYDKVFDFRYKVEGKYIKFSNEPGSNTFEWRRKQADGKCWYDVYDEFGLYGTKGDIYLTQDEIDRNKKIRSDGKKRILWQPMGSGRNKILPFMMAYIKHLAEAYPETEHWIFGSDATPISAIPDLPNVKDLRGKTTVRQAVTLVLVFDLVIGPDSGFVNAAGALDVPSVCFGSICNKDNLARFFRKCAWIEPQCDCYPCYLIVKEWRTIWDLDARALARDQELFCAVRDQHDKYRMTGYKCTTFIDHKKAMDTIIKMMFDR